MAVIESNFYLIQSEAGKERKKYPQLRKGQAIFTVAHNLFPDYVTEVMKEVDCFYVDSNIEKFLSTLEKKVFNR